MIGIGPPRSKSVVASLTAVLVLTIAVAAAAQNRAPLLLPGKQTLYQRVLTRPGAELMEQPGAASGHLIDAFSRFYVYARQQQGTDEWLEVGIDTKGNVKGWVRSQQTAPWRQQMALAFTNPGAARERALFFDSWATLESFLTSPEPAAETVPLTQKIAAGGRDPRVVAIEPDTFVDIQSHFYLLPILDNEEVYTEAGFPVRGLKVASVTKVGAEPTPSADETAQTLRSFRAAVVFVVDSTISMQQYIDEAQQALRKVYDRVQGSGILDKVAFGLVDFRAPSKNSETQRKLGYVARLVADPSKDSLQSFLLRIATLKEAPVSTDAFDEDSYAGILKAIDEIPWKEFGARYIVLITDAGALEGDKSETGLQAAEVRSRAKEKGIALLTLHLKTPQGRANHGKAEAQYNTLANNAVIQESLYFPVDGGSVASYTKEIGALADSIIEGIEKSSRGELAAGSPRSAPPNSEQSPQDDPETLRMREVMAALGHAMQLAYLGKVQGTRAPLVFEGWISDRDFADPAVATVDVRVLLTKDQLSDLHRVLKEILDAAHAGQLKPDAFFESLRSLAAQFGRDPNLASSPQATRLADLGLLGEYLDDLPYKSDLMSLQLDDWSRWGPQRQFDFINQLKSKIQLYDLYNADLDGWVSLAKDSPPGEQVYPVPLSDLP